MSYSNPKYGVRRAVAEVLGVQISEVDLRALSDGTFAIVRPEGAKPDPAAVAALADPPPEDPEPLTDVERKALEMAQPTKALIVEDAKLALADVAEAREAIKAGDRDLALEKLVRALESVLAKQAGEQPEHLK